jgi:hypothetical protein
MNSYDAFIRVSNGDGLRTTTDAHVTGLHVASGATLRLGDNWVDSYVSIAMPNDLVNDGTITVDDLSLSGRRSGLEFRAVNYYGTGVIDTSATRDGQHAGYARISATGSIFNYGEIRTFGGDSRVENGGNGGDIWFQARGGNIENTGRFFTQGGSSAGAAGGNGGGFRLDGWGNVYNAADHLNTGGDGITAGGMGAGFVVENHQPGELRFAGSVDGRGGSAIDGAGGPGGWAHILARGSTIRFSGTIDSRGGHTLSDGGSGGYGGYVNVSSRFHDGGSGFTFLITENGIPPGDIYWEGSILVSGGSSPREGTGLGGWGGYVTMDLDANWFPRAQQLRYAGLNRILTNGGAGASGGVGGRVRLESTSVYDYVEKVYKPGGPIFNHGAIVARGGEVFATAAGGLGQGGTGGDAELNGYGDITNTASIDTSGGHDRAALGGSLNIGGGAGHIYLENGFGTITNSGALVANGGDGLRRGGAPFMILIHGPQAANSGNITSNGGNADPAVAGSVGGRGGTLWFDVNQLLSQTGTISLKGGTGQTPGANGFAF